MLDLSCPDWEERIVEGRSLIPDIQLNEPEARLGLSIFDELQLPDVPGLPKMRDAAGPWFRSLVRVAFGSWDPIAQLRSIRDIFIMLPKGQSKTTYTAGLLLAAMLMNRRPRAEALFLGPTHAIAENAYDKAVGMIEASPDLKRRFRTRDHIKTIEDLDNHSELRVKTFDLNILTGSILIFAVVEELHLLGRNPHASKVLRQIRGGLEKTPEGLLVMPTTQSDDAPAGVFREELLMARKIRDGKFRGKTVRPMLPLIYELPPEIARDQARWQDPATWSMVMPNLGRSVHLNSLIADWETEKSKGGHAVRVWASQHLNIEIGIGLKTDAWRGADHWLEAEDPTLTFETLLERSEAIVAGCDGGGLDDLFGLTLLGREKETRRWLSWSHAWCKRSVLENRQTIAAALQSFADDGELTIVEKKESFLPPIVDLIVRVKDAGLLASVAVDVEGPFGELVEALGENDITEEAEQIVGIHQGFRLMSAIKTSETKLENGSFVHAPSRMMNWSVGNVKIEPTATAIRATKQNAGDAKIDCVTAMWDAATVMVKNPDAAGSIYSKDRGLLVFSL